MDIHLEIDDRGVVTFSACPQEILTVALCLNPRDDALRVRAELLKGADQGEPHGCGSSQEPDQH